MPQCGINRGCATIFIHMKSIFNIGSYMYIGSNLAVKAYYLIVTGFAKTRQHNPAS